MKYPSAFFHEATSGLSNELVSHPTPIIDIEALCDGDSHCFRQPSITRKKVKKKIIFADYYIKYNNLNGKEIKNINRMLMDGFEIYRYTKNGLLQVTSGDEIKSSTKLPIFDDQALQYCLKNHNWSLDEVFVLDAGNRRVLEGADNAMDEEAYFSEPQGINIAHLESDKQLIPYLKTLSKFPIVMSQDTLSIENIEKLSQLGLLKKVDELNIFSQFAKTDEMYCAPISLKSLTTLIHQLPSLKRLSVNAVMSAFTELDSFIQLKQNSLPQIEEVEFINLPFLNAQDLGGFFQAVPNLKRIKCISSPLIDFKELSNLAVVSNIEEVGIDFMLTGAVQTPNNISKGCSWYEAFELLKIQAPEEDTNSNHEVIKNFLKKGCKLKLIHFSNFTLDQQLELAASSLKGLEAIYLEAISFKPATLDNLFYAAPYLKKIILKDTKIPEEGFKLISKGLASVKELSLKGSTLSAGDLACLLHAMPQLEQLDLTRCKITTPTQFSNLLKNSLPNLKAINLSSADKDSSADLLLKRFFLAAPKLEKIDLNLNFSFKGDIGLMPNSLQRLKEVDFSYTRIEPKHLDAFFKAACNVERVNLNGSRDANGRLYVDALSRSGQMPFSTLSTPELRLDNITSSEGVSSLSCQQIIENVGPAHYRMDCYQFSKNSFSLIEHKKNIQPMGEETSQSTDEAYSAQLPIDSVTPGEWYALATLGRDDKVHLEAVFRGETKLEPSQYTLGYDKDTCFYYIKFASSQEPALQSVVVQYKALHSMAENQDDSREQSGAPSVDRLFLGTTVDSDGDICPPTDVGLRGNKVNSVSNLPTTHKIKLLDIFCASFSDKALSTQPINETPAALFLLLVKEKAGVCRHRAFVFAAFCNAFNIPCQVIGNEIHQFVEVYDKYKKKWEKHDLGGGRVNLDITPFKAFKLQSKQQSSTQLLLTNAAQDTRINPFLKPMPCARNMSELETRLPVYDAKPVLLMYNDKDALNAFYNETLSKFGSSALWVQPKDIRMLQHRIDSKGLAQSCKSELGEFLKAVTPSPRYLFVDFSSFKPEHVGIYTALADSHVLAGESIPSQVHVFILLPEVTKKNRGELFSRFVDHTINISHYSKSRINPLPVSTPLEQSAEICEIDLYGQEDFKSQLLGKIEFNKQGQITATPGKLLNALLKGKPVRIDHPPSTDVFQRFIHAIKTRQCCYWNGKTYSFSHPVQIEFTDTPYEFDPKSYTLKEVKCFSDIPISLAVKVLNQATFHDFFGLYSCHDGQLIKQSGWVEAAQLKQYLPVVVTEELPASSWSRLLAEAKKWKVKLDCFACDTLFVNALGAISEDGQVSPSTSTASSSETDICLSVTQTNEPDFVYATTKTTSDSILLRINESTTYADLFGMPHVAAQSNEQHFSFSVENGPVTRGLHNSIQVYLVGKINALLMSQLKTLALSQAYFVYNGVARGTPSETKVHLITSTEIDAAGLVLTEKMITAQAMFDQLSTQYNNRLAKKIYNAIEKLSKTYGNLIFSYPQLDKIFCYAEQYPLRNPLLPFLQQEKAAVSLSNIAKQFGEKFALLGDIKTRKAALLDVLKHFPAIFLFSETGAGKSTFMLEHVADSSHTVYLANDKGDIQKWVRATDNSQQHILFIDEANLGNTKQLVESLQGYDSLAYFLMNDKFCRLTQNHKIVFAGNPMSDQRRESQQYFESVPFIEFKAYSPELMKSMLLEAFKKIPTASGVIQTVIQAKKPSDTLRDLSSKVMLNLCDHALLTKLSNFVLTDNWKEPFSKAQKALNIRDLKKQHQLNQGKSGLLLIGDSALGKTTLIHQLLKLRYPQTNSYLDLTGIAQSPEALEKALINAFHEGQIVLIDEINTLPFIEKLLTKIMSGTDPQGNPPRKPGFYLIGTQNASTHYIGRVKHSKAILNRFEVVSIEAYVELDYLAILSLKNPSQITSAIQLKVQQFMDAKKKQPELTLRELMDGLEAQPVNTPLENDVVAEELSASSPYAASKSNDGDEVKIAKALPSSSGSSVKKPADGLITLYSTWLNYEQLSESKQNKWKRFLDQNKQGKSVQAALLSMCERYKNPYITSKLYQSRNHVDLVDVLIESLKADDFKDWESIAKSLEDKATIQAERINPRGDFAAMLYIIKSELVSIEKSHVIDDLQASYI